MGQRSIPATTGASLGARQTRPGLTAKEPLFSAPPTDSIHPGTRTEHQAPPTAPTSIGLPSTRWRPMNFLKVDRSLYSQKCSLVQITDTVDATETVLYRDIECSSLSPLARSIWSAVSTTRPISAWGMPAGAMFVISKPAATTPAMRVKLLAILYRMASGRSTTGTKPPVS